MEWRWQDLVREKVETANHYNFNCDCRYRDSRNGNVSKDLFHPGKGEEQSRQTIV